MDLRPTQHRLVPDLIFGEDHVPFLRGFGCKRSIQHTRVARVSRLPNEKQSKSIENQTIISRN